MKLQQHLAVIAALAVAPCVAQTSSAVTVTAWGQHYGGQVLYKYDVQNTGAAPIKRFLVGHNPGDASGAGPELSVVPIRLGNTFWLPSDVARSPAGWGALLAPAEEKEKFSIEWIEAGYFSQLWPKARPSPEAPRVVPGTTGILPGATVSEFSVTLPRTDAGYVSGHATVDVGNALATVQMVKGDAAAPAIALNVERVNQNDSRGTWAIFSVTYSVSDNYDHGPVSAFEPISANQPVSAGDIVTEKNNANAWNVKLRNVPGRIYTFSVRAFDASGNMALKQYQHSVAR